MLRNLGTGLRSLFREERLNRELDEGLRENLEMAAEGEDEGRESEEELRDYLGCKLSGRPAGRLCGEGVLAAGIAGFILLLNKCGSECGARFYVFVLGATETKARMAPVEMPPSTSSVCPVM